MSLATVTGLATAIAIRSQWTIPVSLWRWILIGGGIGLALAGMVQVEQAFRNASASDRWCSKYLLLGVGFIFAYDLCLYSTSFLAGAISPLLWQTRGAVNALVVPILAIGAWRWHRRDPILPGPIGATFYTTVLVAVGIYLIAMAAVAQLLHFAGGSWSAALQVVFLCAALLILVLVLFSEQARAWLKVFVAKTFAPYKYDYRVEWLRLINTLSDTSGKAALEDRCLLALARIVHSPSGVLWVREEGGLLVARAGELATLGATFPLAGQRWLDLLAEREWILDLRGRLPPWLAGTTLSDWITSQRRTWLVVPLLHGNALVGLISIAEPLVSCPVLTWEDLDLLKTAARQIASFLELDRTARRLALSREFDAYNRFAAFVMHDIKNLLAQQMLVAKNFGRHRSNPAFIDDALVTIENSVQRMSRLLEQLKGANLGGEASRRRTPSQPLVEDAVQRCCDRLPAPTLILSTEEPADVMVNPERFVHVLELVIRNAQDATPANGSVRVELRRAAQHVVVEVVDNGHGMDAEFVRVHLFRPFHSTKGSQGMGIGAYQAREFVIQAGGYVTVESEVERGTRFAMFLPRAGSSEEEQRVALVP